MRYILLFFLLCAVLLTGCGKTPPPQTDADLAYRLTEKAASMSPHVSGTAELAETAEWIAEEAAKNPAAEVAFMKFREKTPAGETGFCNVTAEIPGRSKKFVIVGTHFDTKYFNAFPFTGANDGASGTGALLAMIRALEGITPPVGIRFVFFDGEEARVAYGANDGLHGSRHAAEQWEKDGSLKDCLAMILLDMIGDRELCITLPADTPPRLRKLAKESAKETGRGGCISDYPFDILDDHIPFARKGIPAIDLIDFQYGPGNSYWHTPEDTMDKISKESLSTAADLTFRMIWKLAEEK